MPILKSLLVFLSLCWGFSLAAQELLVVASDSGEPLPGVLIYSTNPGIALTTNAFGKADLASFIGSKQVMVQLLGYKSATFSWEDLVMINFRIELMPSPITLDVAVISASRWNQNSQDVAGKVDYLDPKLATLRNPATTADWLGNSGHVFVQKSQLGGGSPMIRGFSANRLLYSVDGIRMNSAIFRSGNLQNVISLDPFSLQKTEILFGPGSVMYGSDAIGGVMVFETLSPDSGPQQLRGSLLSRFSSATSENTIHGDFSFGKGKWSFLTSVSYFKFGDLKMGSKNGQESYLRSEYVMRKSDVDQLIPNPNPRIQVGTGYSQLNLMQKIKLQANDRTTWDYGFHLSSTGNIPRYDRLIEKNNGKLRFARWDYGPQKWILNSIRLTHQANNRWFDQAKVIGAYQYFEESRIDRRFGNPTEFNRKEHVYAYSLNADFFKNFSEGTFLTYGIEGVVNSVISRGLSKNITSKQYSTASARYPNAHWASMAAFGSFQRQIGKKIKFQSAIRYNFNSIKADFKNNLDFFPLPFEKSTNVHHSLTGNLGLIFLLQPGLSISPLLSTGFRAPNVDDIGKIFDSQPGAVVVPNPNLTPEYAYNAEININKLVTEWLKFDLTGYYTYLDRAMVRRPFVLNGINQLVYDGEVSQIIAIQNASFAEINGIQAGFELAFTKRLLFSSSYNWQKGIEELDDASVGPSRHAAPAFGLTRLSYFSPRLKMELTANYSTEVPYEKLPIEEISKPALYAQDPQGNPYSPSWFIFNLNCSFQMTPILQLNAGIENLTDQQYRSYSSGIVAPGRNFSLSIKASF